VTMMKTRRKSKVATAAAEDLGGRSSSPLTEEFGSATLFVELPDDLDVESLSNFLPDIPLSNPTPESIVLLYRHLLTQASEVDATQRDLDDARAEVERKDVELDQALQDRESMAKELELSLEVAHKEVKQIGQERDQLGNLFFCKTADKRCLIILYLAAASQASLKAQIVSLSNSQSASSAEAENLKRQIEETEREKRNLIGVVRRVKQESADRDGERPFWH
jgi:nucleoprotein TPR